MMKQLMGLALILIALVSLVWVLKKIHAIRRTKYRNNTKGFIMDVIDYLLDDGIVFLIVLWLVCLLFGNLLLFQKL